MRLLSPQHYSQQLNDHRGTYSTNYGDQVLFVFHKGKFRATMPLSSTTNVGIIRSAPGAQVFSCFVESALPPKEPPPALFCCNVITDDEADDMELMEEDESVASSFIPAMFKGGYRLSADRFFRRSANRPWRRSADRWRRATSNPGRNRPSVNRSGYLCFKHSRDHCRRG